MQNKTINTNSPTVMYNLKKLIVCMAGAAFALNLHAQQVQGFVHKQSEATDYVWLPTNKYWIKLDGKTKFRSLVSLGTLFRSRHCRSHGPSARKDVDWISHKKPLPYDEYKISTEAKTRSIR